MMLDRSSETMIGRYEYIVCRQSRKEETQIHKCTEMRIARRLQDIERRPYLISFREGYMNAFHHKRLVLPSPQKEETPMTTVADPYYQPSSSKTPPQDHS
jgi:hypothetical protein